MFYTGLPESVVESSLIEKRLGLSEGWIKSRTGIDQRREYHGPMSDLAVMACQSLFDEEQIEKSDIDLVLCCTVTPDHPWPASACIIAQRLGIKAPAFDISASCSGFIYGLRIVQSFLISGAYQRILLITGDCMSSIVDKQDRNTAVLFGDACVASLWRSEKKDMIRSVVIGADGSGYHDIIVRNGGSANRIVNEIEKRSLFLDGPTVFKAAVKRMTETILETLAESRLSLADIDWLVPHQANMRILTAVSENLGIEPGKVLSNLNKYGNTTNASIPLCLAEHEHKFRRDDRILMCSFGAGYTWGSAIIQWM